MKSVETSPTLVQSVYDKMNQDLSLIRKRLARPLSLCEKILFSHLKDPKNQELIRNKSFLQLYPDRVGMQDATAQMALLQFMLAKKMEACVPSSVHCDHLIRAYEGMEKDIKLAMEENKEVYDFLESASSHYGIGFWKPGSGIIHQVILENYAFPGGLMIGTDSHTPNAGGLSMLAIGVGGADASDVMAGLYWEVKNPKIIGVHLKGKLKNWTSAKDVILKLCGILTVKGGTDHIIEYFGPGCSSISATGKATITNMGAELGATCSVFPFDEHINHYLKATKREKISELSQKNKDFLKADPEVLENPKKFYDQVIEIDLDHLDPYIVGPHSPDLAHSIKDMKEVCQKNKWPTDLSAALIGSCTNSSYEDLTRSCSIAEQALENNLKMPMQFMISPGSSQIKKTIERDGLMDTFQKLGATVLANACGPCIGQWKRDDFKKNEVNTILSSFNRNFRGRNDANPETLSFIASPEITMAIGLSGRLDFNPEQDELTGSDGKKFKLKAPTGKTFPEKAFIFDQSMYVEPKGKSVSIKINKNSDRIQILEAFKAWNKKDISKALVLCKAKGKCTTDHISPAGKWLKYRGHLDHISDNLLLGATNAFSEEIGKGLNILNNKVQNFSEIARFYKAQNKSSVIFGEHNYGEGSSREHAAMSPRYLGVVAVIAKSFARIHLTNLKKQGVLALTFENEKDYDLVQKNDLIDIKGLTSFQESSLFTMILNHPDGSVDEIQLRHSFTKEQIVWFQKGSSLNSLSALGE